MQLTRIIKHPVFSVCQCRNAGKALCNIAILTRKRMENLSSKNIRDFSVSFT